MLLFVINESDKNYFPSPPINENETPLKIPKLRGIKVHKINKTVIDRTH